MFSGRVEFRPRRLVESTSANCLIRPVAEGKYYFISRNAFLITERASTAES